MDIPALLRALMTRLDHEGFQAADADKAIHAMCDELLIVLERMIPPIMFHARGLPTGTALRMHLTALIHAAREYYTPLRRARARR